MGVPAAISVDAKLVDRVVSAAGGRGGYTPTGVESVPECDNGWIRSGRTLTLECMNIGLVGPIRRLTRNSEGVSRQSKTGFFAPPFKGPDEGMDGLTQLRPT
jgi:hypothetical protein